MPSIESNEHKIPYKKLLTALQAATDLWNPFGRHERASFHGLYASLRQPTNKLKLRLQWYRAFFILQSISWANFNYSDMICGSSTACTGAPAELSAENERDSGSHVAWMRRWRVLSTAIPIAHSQVRG
jgi:hypothetical protein